MLLLRGKLAFHFRGFGWWELGLLGEVVMLVVHVGGVEGFVSSVSVGDGVAMGINELLRA